MSRQLYIHSVIFTVFHMFGTRYDRIKKSLPQVSRSFRKVFHLMFIITSCCDLEKILQYLFSTCRKCLQTIEGASIIVVITTVSKTLVKGGPHL